MMGYYKNIIIIMLKNGYDISHDIHVEKKSNKSRYILK